MYLSKPICAGLRIMRRLVLLAALSFGIDFRSTRAMRRVDFDGAPSSDTAGPFGDPALGTDFATWLENDLIKANANRDQVPWIIANGTFSRLGKQLDGTHVPLCTLCVS